VEVSYSQKKHEGVKRTTEPPRKKSDGLTGNLNAYAKPSSHHDIGLGNTNSPVTSEQRQNWETPHLNMRGYNILQRTTGTASSYPYYRGKSSEILNMKDNEEIEHKKEIGEKGSEIIGDKCIEEDSWGSEEDDDYQEDEQRQGGNNTGRLLKPRMVSKFGAQIGTKPGVNKTNPGIKKP